MHKRIKLTQFQVLELCSRVKHRFAAAHPSVALNLNTNPANYQPLANAINESYGEARVSETWLRDLITYAANAPEGKVVSSYQLEALNQFLGTDNTGENVIREADKRLRGKYRFLWRGTRLERAIAKEYIVFQIEFTDTEIRFYEEGTGATYFKHHHLFLNGIDYISLMDQHHSELVFLTLHRGQAYGQDLNAIPGLYLGADTGYLPCAGPVLLVREGVDYDHHHQDRYFRNYDFSSIKGRSITEVSGYVRRHQQAGEQYDNERRSGLEGEWLNVLFEHGATEYEVSYLTIPPQGLLYESRASRYTNGEIRLSGERSLIIHIREVGRETTFIGDIGNYRKTRNIKRFAASFTATGLVQPVCGHTVFFRRNQLIHDLEIGVYSAAELVAAGIGEDLVAELRERPFTQVPGVSNF